MTVFVRAESGGPKKRIVGQLETVVQVPAALEDQELLWGEDSFLLRLDRWVLLLYLPL